jgi:hypothetical protein
MNKSPQRGSFHIETQLKQVEEGRKTVEQAQEMIDFYQSWDEQKAEREQDPEWRKNNLEYDLRSTQWICDKAKAREEYAQNIYAALCNTDWQRNDVWPLLKGQTYSCSWRYAGGIVADMLESGDYIDWYCSGIRGMLSDEDRAGMSPEDIERHDWMNQHFVGEGHVTDEIREDFFKLGWILVEND